MSETTMKKGLEAAADVLAELTQATGRLADQVDRHLKGKWLSGVGESVAMGVELQSLSNDATVLLVEVSKQVSHLAAKALAAEPDGDEDLGVFSKSVLEWPDGT